MNILYRGNYSPTVYRFKCNECEAVWEWTYAEIQKMRDTHELFLTFDCPFCGKKVTNMGITEYSFKNQLTNKK